MTRSELLQTAKPILFNTEMVRAILDESKTATRRIAKGIYPYSEYGDFATKIKGEWQGPVSMENIVKFKSPYLPGDIRYVRETWQRIWKTNDRDQIIEGTDKYYYKADGTPPFTYYVDPDTGEHRDIPWRPSIHMPKKAARIFLEVTDVRVEHLQDMTLDDFLAEGVVIRPEAFNDPENAYQQAKETFTKIWNSTIKRPDIDRYGWEANPWVWAIEFERIETNL